MKIRTKLSLFSSITVLISIISITIYSVYNFRMNTLESIESYEIEQTEIIKNQLKDHVNNSYKIIEQAHEMVISAGELMQSASSNTPGDNIIMSNFLRLTVENIRKIRFGEAGYIWINEIAPPYTVIMHPIKPEMEGTTQVFYIKDTQQNVYEAFANAIRDNEGAGFLKYDFYKPGTNEKIPKLSYIRLYAPLGWVIGTGVYIDNIDKIVARKTEQLNEQTNQMVTYIIIFGFVIIIFTIAALYFIVRTITDVIYFVRKQHFQMSKGHIIEKSINTKNDEIGNMTASLNDLIDGMNSYSEFALSIGEGNLDVQFKSLSTNDILGNSLLKMRENLKTARREEKIRRMETERRNWANEGYTMFGDLMRKNSDDLVEMSFEIINNLVNYLHAVQGGLFIYNDDDKENHYIELVASTAYNRRKFKKKKIMSGDGLIGACALEKQKIYLTNIPEDYIEIRSGLGTANPEAILIIPLVVEDNITGIIELAAFKKFDEFEIEFVEKISEGIAASIYSAKINEKTSALLEEFKLFGKEKDKLLTEAKEKDAEIKKLKRKLRMQEAKKPILSFN